MSKKNPLDYLLPGPGVSFNENNIYIMSHDQPYNDIYSLRVILRWQSDKRPFDYDLFKRIFDYLVNRHEAFSYTFHQDQETKRVSKKIHRGPHHIEIPIHKIPYQETDKKFMAYCKELGKGFFPLVTAPLIKVNVVYDKDQVVYTVIFLPHIIMDGYSNARVLYAELLYLYSSFIERPQGDRTFDKFRAELKDPKPYSDFVEKEKLIFAKKLEFVKSYYKEKYKPVDLRNRYITMETEEKMVKGRYRLIEKTQIFKDFLERNNLRNSQVIFTIYQLTLFKIMNLATTPIVKLFNNRSEEYNGTVGFLACELVFVEEVREEETIEELYKRNSVSSRFMMENVHDVDGTLAVGLAGLPIPRFKYNYIPKEMVDVSDSETRYVNDPEFFDSWNWEGDLFKIKFGIVPFDHEDFIYLTSYNTVNDFPEDTAVQLTDTIRSLLTIIPKIWRTPIKNIPEDLCKNFKDSSKL
jgi:hypothetical protein